MASYAAPEGPEAPQEAPEVELPSLEQRIEWVEDWEESTYENRRLQRRDRDYYDGHQLTQDDLDRLKARNQPPIVKNRIKRKIDYLVGEVIRKGISPAWRPRTPQHDDASRAATDAARYVADEQGFNEVRAAVAFDLATAGVAGTLKTLEPSAPGRPPKHCLTRIEWDRLIADPASRDLHYRDALYIGLVVWMDLDEAIRMYPEAEEALRAASTTQVASDDEQTDDIPRGWVFRKGSRLRVKLCELYFQPGGKGTDWYRACFTRGADIAPPSRTEYLDEDKVHSVCPLIMTSCYVDNNGSRYGVVRNLISPQDEVNKRASKSLHLLNVHRVIAEEGVVEDPQDFMTQIAKADGFAQVRQGALKDGSIEVATPGELAAGHIQLMQVAQQDIDTIGPSASTLPELPNTASGRAFLARQQAAAQELGSYFAVLRTWGKRVFELDWLCVRQAWTEETWLRITDDNELNGYRFTAINQRTTRAARLQDLVKKGAPFPKALEMAAGDMLPYVQLAVAQQQKAMAASGQQVPPQMAQQLLQQAAMAHPLMQQPVTTNQVEHILVDLVLDEAPDTAILAQEEFATLSDLLPTVVQARPDMAAPVVKMLIQASSLPNKRELLEEMAKGPSPQQQQQQQQAQAMQQAQAKAGIAVAQSQAQLNQAKAQQAQADASTKQPLAQAEIKAKHAKAMGDVADVGAAIGTGLHPGGM